MTKIPQEEKLFFEYRRRIFLRHGDILSLHLREEESQQHPLFEGPLQSQEGSPPVIILLIRAAAHPTPAFTLIAPNSQFLTQAPHSMQRSLSVIVACLSFMSKTPCGHTSVHLPQPEHFSGKNSRLVTFDRYFIPHPTEGV
jgi:hypothetical protein